MKVVWFSHSGELSGGAEISLFEAVEGLIERGIEVSVVLPSRGELSERLEGLGVRTYVVPFTVWVSRGSWRSWRYRLKRTGRNLFFLRRVLRLISDDPPDVVVSNTLAVPIGALAAKLARVPHVWYVQELFGAEGHGLHFDLGQRFSLSLMERLSARLMVNSETVLRSFRPHISHDK